MAPEIKRSVTVVSVIPGRCEGSEFETDWVSLVGLAETLLWAPGELLEVMLGETPFDDTPAEEPFGVLAEVPPIVDPLPELTPPTVTPVGPTQPETRPSEVDQLG